MPDDRSLYERLGGRASIEAVVDEFYERVLADESLAPYFVDADVDELRRHQTAFLTAVAGGPDAYDGRKMRAAHDHLDVTAGVFERVAEHLAAALSAFDVPEGDREKVLSAVASYEDAIVTA